MESVFVLAIKTPGENSIMISIMKNWPSRALIRISARIQCSMEKTPNRED